MDAVQDVVHERGKRAHARMHTLRILTLPSWTRKADFATTGRLKRHRSASALNKDMKKELSLQSKISKTCRTNYRTGRFETERHCGQQVRRWLI